MNDTSESIPTRRSLLGRLRDGNDEESWRVFFETYWKLIYHTAVSAGLSDAEAQDVVQETVLSVLRSMPRFDYSAKKGSFKHWLLRLTRWRITDELRKRGGAIPRCERSGRPSTETATIERVPDPDGLGLETLWDREWEKSILDAAMARVKRQVDGKQYQVFDLYVLKKWPVSKVARMLHINPAKVYLAKHRVNKLVKKEVARLQANPL